MASNGWFATTSTQEDNGKKYYFNKDGRYLTDYWAYDPYGKTWSYAKKTVHKQAADWLKSLDGYWYYFDDYGVMVTNSWYDTLSNGSWKKYYFDKNGHPLTLHLTTEFDKNGSPITNHCVYDSKNKLWGYAKDDGTPALEEWIRTSNSHWYYFNNAGVMATNGWYNTPLKDGNWKKYYFDQNGNYLTDRWVYDSYGKIWSYTKTDGTQAIREWVKTPNGRWYYFDKNGHYLTNHWAYDADNKTWSYAKNDGTRATEE